MITGKNYTFMCNYLFSHVRNKSIWGFFNLLSVVLLTVTYDKSGRALEFHMQNKKYKKA